MAKYNTEVANYIFDNYIFNQELVKHDENLSQLDLLVDNKRAVRIDVPFCDDFYGLVSEYNVVCKFLIKEDKSLKKFTMVENDPSLPRTRSRKTIIDDYMNELKQYRIEFGTYYVHLGDKSEDNYAVLHSEKDKDDSFCFSFRLYLIGPKCYKYRSKIFDKLNEYKERRKKLQKESHNRICYDFNNIDEIKFKPFDFMVFENKDEILKTIETWKNNLPKYSKYKIIPKLSVLLHGLPGTGKSTFYKALADMLDIDTVISLSPGYFLEMFGNGQEKQRRYMDGIIAIDDIDCICKSREDEKDNRENSAIMHNLLSFLDNPPTTFIKLDDQYYEVAIVVATTNYIDKLDKAVKRHGRFDLKIEMDYFNKERASEMCSIYELKLEDVINKPITDDFRIAPAELEALCISNIDKNMKG